MKPRGIMGIARFHFSRISFRGIRTAIPENRLTAPSMELGPVESFDAELVCRQCLRTPGPDVRIWEDETLK